MRSACITLATTAAVLGYCSVTEAQPMTALKLFHGAPVSESAPCVNPGACSPTIDRVVFDEITLSMTCPAKPIAVLSSSGDGRGGLIVDNFIDINGRNVCAAGVILDGASQCYNEPFVGTLGMPASASYQPVPPINVSGNMPARGKGTVVFDLVDYGGVYANADVWLVTNCKIHQRVGICHKPGTPAEKILTISGSAIAGHLRHGDTLDLSVCRR